MVALDAAGVKVAEIVEDAVQRDRALDTYERVLQKHLEDLRAAEGRREPAASRKRSTSASPSCARASIRTTPSSPPNRTTCWPGGCASARKKIASPRPSAISSRRIRSRRPPRRLTREAPMFDRLGRLFRAWMGFFISMGEDPEVMLQDAIEEMRITMPKLNSVLVATRATVIRLEEERDALRRQDKNLTASIQAALREGTAAARSVAEEDAIQLQQVRMDLASTEEQLAVGAEGARERADVGGHAEAEAQGEDRDLPARAEGAAEGGGHEDRRRRDRRAAVLRRGVDRRQVPRADQAGSRRVEGGRRSRHRLDRHQGASSASARRAR